MQIRQLRYPDTQAGMAAGQTKARWRQVFKWIIK